MRLPNLLDRWLRLLFVTPDFHRVHHSTKMEDNNRNFSNIFTTWDYLFRSYKAEPIGGHEAMEIGLDEFRHPKHMLLHWMIINPLIAPDENFQRSVDVDCKA